MEAAYTSLNLHHAYELTNDFFRNILRPIYVAPLRRRIISYPNHHLNSEHFQVMGKVLQMVLPVITPLLPFTAYHIAQNTLSWPSPSPRHHHPVPLHSQMIKLRLKVRRKLSLNQLNHAQIYCPTPKTPFNLTDLELFLDVDSVTQNEPNSAYRACSV